MRIVLQQKITKYVHSNWPIKLVSETTCFSTLHHANFFINPIMVGAPILTPLGSKFNAYTFWLFLTLSIDQFRTIKNIGKKKYLRGQKNFGNFLRWSGSWRPPPDLYRWSEPPTLRGLIRRVLISGRKLFALHTLIFSLKWLIAIEKMIKITLKNFRSFFAPLNNFVYLYFLSS